ncbi:oxidoreductase [Emericellopsis atlantica]|uniref:Oxidoreductase n=1 Tax=Emericellopsis atlantica TaxID=2614577 RepID=A0A9P7ZHG6_9HYPO|nr:oxidoreductase [Emericellopsis atlantica]KAG9252159.1 oxidoreductase [Emericellopsis atlantica]
MASKEPLSFIGLGAMGFGMATNLIKEGYAVTGFDVWAPTLERFTKEGGSTASTPAEAASGKNVCICMVATAQQAQEVLLDGEKPAVPALPKGAVVLLCSTVPCSYVQELEKAIHAAGRPDVHLIDCPVSGGAIRAGNGTLSIMAGASDAAIARGQELLQVMSDPAKLYIVAGGIGAGSNMKMCHQVLAANQIASASEAMGLAHQLDLDLSKTAEALIKSDGWSWMLENRMPRILDADHGPLASAVNIIIKDTSIITVEARRAEFPTPMTSTAEQMYFLGLGKGYGTDDDASLIRLYTEGKGKLGPVKAASTTDDEKLALVTSLLKGIHLCAAAETLSFAHHVGLDLEQVFELCINAAGGSAMLSKVGPNIMKALRGEARGGDALQLADFARDLGAAVDEAQRLKVPVFLGNSALNLIRVALRKAGADAAADSVVSVWSS